MLIVYAPDAAAASLAGELAGICGERCVPAAQASPEDAKVLLLVTTDYYSRALWRLKRRLSEWDASLEGKLCACLVRSAGGSGADLAIRSLASQLLASGSAVCLCGAADPDGTVRFGSCTQTCMRPKNILEFYTKLRIIAEKFG